MVAVVWFRNDLRLTDHLALDAAIKTEQPVLPIYIYDETCARPLGSASKWWLHHSLTALKSSLNKLDADLILRKGVSFQILKQLLSEISISHLFWHRRYDEQGMQQDQEIKTHFKNLGIFCQSFNGSLLFESNIIKNKQGNAFKVFTSFWKSCLSQIEVDKPIPSPSSLNFDRTFEKQSETLASFQLLPTHPDWAAGLNKTWNPGEEGAEKLFQIFLQDKLQSYRDQRNKPAAMATSDLSAHIRWGEISVQQLWHAVKQISQFKRCEQSGEKFLTELGWRDFSYYTLFHHPKLANQPLREEFNTFPWDTNESFFKAWTKGQTGYPLVDAGMRQLWSTGYMHNRVRMVAASFLTKHLLQPWQKGEEWFWDTLVDADSASNAFNWQWVAGCGADAAPYFRIFNPTLQAVKFDPQGDYIKYWIPELKDIPLEFIHEPWLYKNKSMEYPSPIISHAQGRERALLSIKNSAASNQVLE